MLTPNRSRIRLNLDIYAVKASVNYGAGSKHRLSGAGKFCTFYRVKLHSLAVHYRLLT